LEQRVEQFLRYAPCVRDCIAFDVGLVGSVDTTAIVRRAYEMGVLVPGHSWHHVSQHLQGGGGNSGSWTRSMESLRRIVDIPLEVGGSTNYSELLKKLKEETLVFYKGNISLFGSESYRTSKCQARSFAWMALNKVVSSDERRKIASAYGLEGDTRSPNWKQGFPLLQKIFDTVDGEGNANVRLTENTIHISIPGSTKPIGAFIFPTPPSPLLTSHRNDMFLSYHPQMQKVIAKAVHKPTDGTYLHPITNVHTIVKRAYEAQVLTDAHLPYQHKMLSPEVIRQLEFALDKSPNETCEEFMTRLKEYAEVAIFTDEATHTHGLIFGNMVRGSDSSGRIIITPEVLCTALLYVESLSEEIKGRLLLKYGLTKTRRVEGDDDDDDDDDDVRVLTNKMLEDGAFGYDENSTFTADIEC